MFVFIGLAVTLLAIDKSDLNNESFRFFVPDQGAVFDGTESVSVARVRACDGNRRTVILMGQERSR